MLYGNNCIAVFDIMLYWNMLLKYLGVCSTIVNTAFEKVWHFDGILNWEQLDHSYLKQPHEIMFWVMISDQQTLLEILNW